MVDNYGPLKPSVGSPASTTDKGLKKTALRNNVAGPAFTDFLESARQEKQLKISAHALQRMESRQIHLNEADLQEISAAVEKAESKGARSSLLLYGEVALIASITNRTIVTAIDDAEAQDHIFTGIDSAVIVR